MRPLKLLSVAVFLGLLMAGTVQPSSAQTPSPQNAASTETDLNTILMESTFMLEGKNAQGQDTIGTCFIMGRPLAETARGRFVLITAAHVLDDMQGDTVILHFRVKQPDNNWLQVPLSITIRHNGKPLWVQPPDADVAAIYVGLPTPIIPLLSTDLLADDTVLAQYEIHPGDELECLGYPLGLSSNPALFPVLRSGKIASYPLLPTETYKTFLFDFRVFKGNSGGPVYLVASNRSYGKATHLGETIHFIVGLVSGEKFFPQVTLGPYEQEVKQLQLDLAVVVDAVFIKKAINMLPPPDSLPD